MANILCLETSAQMCSVALFQNCDLIDYEFDDAPFSHASKLTVMMEHILLRQKVPLSAIAISGGPGSYTGLRIAASTAKGYAYGYGCPLISIDTLQLMANEFISSSKVNLALNDLILPLIDARRMEVYLAGYDAQLNRIIEPKASILEPESLADLSEYNNVHIIGSGALKAETILQSPNLRFYPDAGKPDAKHMGSLAFKKLQDAQFEDVAYYEPFYLKEFFFMTKSKT